MALKTACSRHFPFAALGKFVEKLPSRHSAEGTGRQHHVGWQFRGRGAEHGRTGILLVEAVHRCFCVLQLIIAHSWRMYRIIWRGRLKSTYPEV